MDEAFDLVGETDGVKVDEKPEIVPGHSQISENLRAVNWKQCGHGFQLNDHRVFNDEINSIGVGNFEILVGDRQQQLAL